jgi:hypothetical protein
MWASVRDALSILLGGNLGEICYGVIGGLLSRTPVMNTRQLLLVNLLTDMAPATVIALRPPRHTSPETLLREGPEASLGPALNREVWVRAVTTTLAATGAWLVARATGRGARARTVGLVALVSAQLGQTMAAGGHSPLVFVTGAASFGALTVAVQTPGVSQFFGCTPLGPVGWAIAGTSASLATAASVVVSRLIPAISNTAARNHGSDDSENGSKEESPVSQVQTQHHEPESQDHVEETTEQVKGAKGSGRQIAHATRLVLAEAAYATLGVGGVTVDLIRRTPTTLRTLNRRAATGVKAAGTQVVRGLTGLARRGHTMVGSAPLQERGPTTAQDDGVKVELPASVEDPHASICEPTVEQPPVEEPAQSPRPQEAKSSDSTPSSTASP